MALTIRKKDSEVLYAAVAAINALRRDATVLGSRFHRGALQTRSGGFRAPVATTETITTANAADLATSVALCNAILAFLKRHVADGSDVHKAADDTATTAFAAITAATDLASAQTAANAIKAAYNAHCSASGVHDTNDSTNTVSSTNASDQASLNTLLNEIKTDINAHVASFPAGFRINLVAP